MITTIFTRVAGAVKNGTALRGCVFLGVMVLLSGSTALMGSSISCTSSGCSGNLGGPNSLAEVNFTAPSNTTLTVTTTSWTGLPGSGFDPVLWLFDTSMNQLGKNDDISASNHNSQIVCPSSGTCPGLPTGLVGGTSYELVLTAFDQHWCVASTNCNGTIYSTTGWSNNGSFNGLSDAFSLTFAPSTAITVNSDFVTVDYPVAQGGRAAVPEPTSLALLLTGGAFLTWRKYVRGR